MKQYIDVDLNLKTYLFLPDFDDPNEHCIIKCIRHFLWKDDDQGAVGTQKDRDFLASFPKKPFRCFEECDDIVKLCEYFHVNCKIYTPKQNMLYSSIQKDKKIYLKPRAAKTMCLFRQENCFALLFCDKNGRCKLKDYVKCVTCRRWRICKNEADWKKNHYNKCIRCSKCGECYKEGSTHEIHCLKNIKYDKKKEDNIIELAKKTNISKNSLFKNIHYADFETLIVMNFEVYAAGLLQEDRAPFMPMGEDSLDKFMNVILNLKGILWFFNGSRFDVYFILKYIIRHGIEYLPKHTILTNNSIITLGFKTCGGKQTLIIKDLARFLVGSLDFNCKGFGVSVDESKGDFDHEKIKTYQDVITHQEEIRDYLRLDVIALKSIYEKFALEVFDQHQINIADCVSISQLAFRIFTSTLTEKKSGLLHKIKKGQHEDVLRAGSYGGRLIMTQPRHECEGFKEVKKMLDEIHRIFENHPSGSHIEQETQLIDSENDSTLKFYDINSLYPTWMHNSLFPCGPYKYFENISERKSNKIINKIMEESKIDGEGYFELEREELMMFGETKKSDDEKPIYKLVFKRPKQLIWGYRFLVVDMECPTDMIVPFLMRRDKEGKNIQTLDPILEQTYYGEEIIEAIHHGYKLKKIHSYFKWKYIEPLFRPIVSATNKRKSRADDNTAPKISAKTIANSLYGKCSQKTVKECVKLVIGDEIGPNHIMQNTTSHMYQDIYDNGYLAAMFYNAPNEDKYSSYPIQLAAAILAGSKVWMSRCKREMKQKDGDVMKDVFRHSKNFVRYGDTDSIIVPQAAIKNANPIIFGPHLGQFKDELPKKQLVAQIVIAPKTYVKWMFEWIPVLGCCDSTGNKPLPLYSPSICFKSKGIPHIRDNYNPYGDYEIKEPKRLEVINIWEFMLEREKSKTKKSDIRYQNVRLKDKFFLKFAKEDEECKNILSIKDRIMWEDAEGIIDDSINIICLYGGMVRNIRCNGDLNNMGIGLNYQKRSLSTNLWWKKGSRNVDDDYPWSCSKPLGFEEKQK